MYDRQVWEATPKNTLIHRLDARTKIIMLTVLALIAVSLDSAHSLFVLFGIMLGMHFLARSSIEQWRILIVFLLFGMWGCMVSQSLFYNQEPRTIVACLLPPSVPVIGDLTGGVFIYREGLEYGAVQALRSCIMLTAGLLLCWTSAPQQLLRCFLYWQMPYEFAFMIITSLRFLPVIFHETAVVITAQRLRGFEPMKTFSPVKLVQTAFQTMFPILARSLRRASTLAFSVESRGFGRGIRSVEMPKWQMGEKLFCGFSILLLCFIIGVKTLFALQYNGILFVPALRGMYDFMTIWM